MAGTPQKRARTTAAEAAEGLRASEAADGVRLDRHGNPLRGAAGTPMSEEVKQKLAEAREKARAERAEKVKGLKRTQAEARDNAIETLWPKAFKVWEMALNNAIERGTVDTQALKAAMALFEQRFGKPTQKVEAKTEQVTKVVYEAAAFQFDMN